MTKILEVKQIYENLKEKVRESIKAGPSLSIASFKIGADYSATAYLLAQEKMANDLGINYRSIDLDSDISVNKIVSKIYELNNDKSISGIIVNKPFPKGWPEGEIFSAISEKKDIEGMNPCNLGRLFYREPIFIPPTVLSVLEFIKVLELDLYGKEVTVVGFSNIIGKPLAILLGKRFATVNITHIATYDLGQLPLYVRRSDILITAVGKPHLIKGEWIKEGAVVIDVGMAEMNGKVVGDVEFEAAEKKAEYITPVPGGVGKLTTLFLFNNLIKASKL